ncbi:hypothetical protein [Acetomicrobium sp.]|uniref:hypothetical protein n=1 Tax=Acetomicrobium sp. TaxID=1872099 RepID=UPI001BCB5019|nr:hypothetical protein [Acetomicrobium sp.]
MKKSAIAVLAVTILISLFGAALAQGSYGFKGKPLGYRRHNICTANTITGWNHRLTTSHIVGYRSYSAIMPYKVKIPTYIGYNIRHMQQHRFNLQSSLYTNPANRFKIYRLHESMLSLQNEIDSWKLKQKIRLHDLYEK